MWVGGGATDAAYPPKSLSLMLFEVMSAGLPSLILRFEA